MTHHRALVSLLMLFAFALPTLNAQQPAPAVNWQALNDAWKKFAEAEKPTDDMLDQILTLLPDRGKSVDNVTIGAPVIEAIMNGLGALENQVFEKNPKAVRVGFRMFAISYGPFEERLAKMLGNLIGFNCLLFLQELAVQQNLLPSLELVVASFRFSKASPDEQETERKYRIKMLESVDDKSVKDIRNECLKILKKIKIG